MRNALVILLLLALAGCVTPTTRRAQVDNSLLAIEQEKQREIALESQARQRQRLLDIGYPLLGAASNLCEKQRRAGLGAYFFNKYSFDRDMRDTAIRHYRLTDTLKLFHLVTNSPAARAGLQQGDLLIQLNGESLGGGEAAMKKFADVLREEITPGAVTRATVLRGRERLNVDIDTDVQCDYSLLTSNDDSVNAFADGNRVVVTRGMLRFAQTDQELGLVVSHEIAHNTMRHIDAKRTNAMGGLIFDILAAAAGVNTNSAFSRAAGNAYSKEFESEADYVGLYLMQRAGFPIENAANFWRRMAAEHPSSIRGSHSATHPATAERFLAIEQTVQEIKRKQSQGLAMTPEFKDPRPQPADPATDSSDTMMGGR